MELIVAVDQSFGISKEGGIPWHSKEDLKHFKSITTTSPDKPNVVVYGRKTMDTLPKKSLEGRINLVLSRGVTKDTESVKFFKNKQGVLTWLDENRDSYNKVFIIGGAQIYEMFGEECDKLHMTIIQGLHECDINLNPQLFKWKLESCTKLSEQASYLFFTKRA